MVNANMTNYTKHETIITLFDMIALFINPADKAVCGFERNTWNIWMVL